MDFNKYYEDRQKLVNTFLEKRLEKKGISRVDEAMAYSLLAGGKRIRPKILRATADALGVSGYNFLPVACGLEMIHTYSLIHDDCLVWMMMNMSRPFDQPQGFWGSVGAFGW